MNAKLIPGPSCRVNERIEITPQLYFTVTRTLLVGKIWHYAGSYYDNHDGTISHAVFPAKFIDRIKSFQSTQIFLDR